MSFVTKVWRLPALTLVETITATTNPQDPRTFDESHTIEDNELGRFEFSTYEVDGFDIQLGDVVAFFDDDVCLGGGVIRQCITTRVSKGVEGKVVQRWVGVRPLGALEFAAIRPVRGLGSAARDRVWGWFGVTYDDTAWGTATEIADIDDLTTHHWQYVLGEEYAASLDPADAAFNDLTAKWIWDASGTTEFATTGDCYGRQLFAVGGGITRIELEAVADAQADFYIEGQRELTTDYIYGDPKPGDIKRVQVDVEPGLIQLAVHAVNNPDYDFDGDHNPAGVAWAVWSIDPATGERLAVLAHSDSSVKWLGYPAEPPGMTPGEIALEVLEEFQAADYLTWITPTFTATHDSNGVEWDELVEVGTKVGYSFWKLVQQMTAVFVDTDIDPENWEWSMWIKGTRGVASGVVYAVDEDPEVSNVLEHVLTETLQRGNQILHYSRYGWQLTPTIGVGLKIDATLDLGALESYPAVERYAEAQRQDTAEDAVEHDVKILPVDLTDSPIHAFGIGDTVTIGGQVEPVVQIDWRRDRNGRIWWDTDEDTPGLPSPERFGSKPRRWGK